MNQKMRGSVLARVGYEVKKSSKDIQAFAAWMESDSFDSDLREAAAHPGGCTFKKVISRVRKLLNRVGKSIPWSPCERTNELQKLYAIGYRRGPPSDFITFSPNPENQSLVLKMGKRDLQGNESSVELWNSTAAAERLKVKAQSPAAASACYDMLVRAVLEGLFGVDIRESSREKMQVRGVVDGSFHSLAHAEAYLAVTEAQARGALHLHILLW